MISTRHLSELPSIETLKKLTQSLALLDAILMRQQEYRYYSFNSKWGENEQMASMSNGSGDEWYCGFGPPGAFLKGFDHESEMSPWAIEVPKVWPGVLDGVPEIFKSFATEPAFSMENTTFCIWREIQDSQWSTGKISFPATDDPDGSEGLLAILDGKPISYKTWAEEYYECSVSLAAVRKIYEHAPLSPELVRELSGTAEFGSLLSDAAEIGYPVINS